jgi:vitamin B12 transporter
VKLSPSLRRRAALASFLVLFCAAAGAVEEVVVTGSREALEPARSVGDVIVIDAARIAASAADSLEELLRREAGLQLSRNGGPGQNAALLIRGLGASGTLVLVDGVRVGSATLGQAEIEAVGLAAVERIEVLRGPASSLYGADATGGVVQIFTRGGGAPRLAARAAAGDFGAGEASLAAGGRAGGVELAATLAHERLHGVSALRPGDLFGNFNPDRDGFARETLQLRAAGAPAPGQRLSAALLATRLDSQFDASEFAPPDFAPNSRPDFRNRLRTTVGSIEHRARWSEAFATTLRAASHEGDLRSGGNTIDRFATRRHQFEVQGSWAPRPGQQLTVALDRLEESAEAAGYAAPVRRDNNAAVLAWAGGIGSALSTQAELRHDRNSAYGRTGTGRVGAALAVGGGWRLRALAGTTFRAPSFNDLHFPGYGVPTIGPERGRSAEIGFERRAAGWDLHATLFRNRVRELIAYESDRSFCPSASAYDFGCARNLGRVRLQGASLGAGGRAGTWQWRGQLELLDAKDERTGARLPRRAAHQASLHLRHSRERWSAAAELLRVGARPDAGKTLAATTTLDLAADWVLAQAWRLEFRLRNATDRDLEPVRDYRGLPRQALIGLRYEGPL